MYNSFEEQVSSKSDEELLAVYANAEDFQAEYIHIVKLELKKRGLSVNDVDDLKLQKAIEIDASIETGRKGNSTYITIGFISACIGGFIGIYAGYHYSKSHQLNSKGEKCYTYNEQTRKQGTLMLILGISIFLGTIAWKLGL